MMDDLIDPEPAPDAPPSGEQAQDEITDPQAIEDALRDSIPAMSEPLASSIPDWPNPGEPAPVLPAAAVRVGETVLVNMGEGTLRPMIVTQIGDPHTGENGVLSGVVFCGMGDHTLPAFREHSAQFLGRPDRHSPCSPVEGITEGYAIAQWRRQ